MDCYKVTVKTQNLIGVGGMLNNYESYNEVYEVNAESKFEAECEVFDMVSYFGGETEIISVCKS